MESTAPQVQTDTERLEIMRQEIVEEIEHLRIDLRNLAEPSADEADINAYEREKTWALVQRLQRKVESVEHAMRMVENGTYGICESCGDRITPARLEILPEATLCLECQRQIERRHKRKRF
jgi:DnaK suppressor protein